MKSDWSLTDKKVTCFLYQFDILKRSVAMDRDEEHEKILDIFA